jgi:hypothetical protein
MVLVHHRSCCLFLVCLPTKDWVGNDSDNDSDEDEVEDIKCEIGFTKIFLFLFVISLVPKNLNL